MKERLAKKKKKKTIYRVKLTYLKIFPVFIKVNAGSLFEYEWTV